MTPADPDRRSPADDDAVPVSVRLGAVVPPEDPEDWRRPLTWVAALGMLAAPAVALAWFALAAPADATPGVATRLLAVVLAGGASAAGATQLDRPRALAGTIAAGLFAALAVIVVGVVTAGERQVGTASPTLAHAFTAALGGVGGALAAALVAPLLVGRLSRGGRWLVAGGVAAAAALAVLQLVA